MNGSQSFNLCTDFLTGEQVTQRRSTDLEDLMSDGEIVGNELLRLLDSSKIDAAKYARRHFYSVRLRLKTYSMYSFFAK